MLYLPPWSFRVAVPSVLSICRGEGWLPLPDENVKGFTGQFLNSFSKFGFGVGPE